jgi:predicted ArsR family transcriptional regulator
MMNHTNGLTRQVILSEIKQRGSATTDELGQDLGISAVAVRQHLSTLAAQGTVSITPERRGYGRPVHRYQITVEGDETFERGYDRLSLELLDCVEEAQGKEGLVALMAARREKLASSIRLKVQDMPLATRVAEVAKLQDGYGYMASVKPDGNDLVLTELNCAICRVAKAHPELCAQELAMLSDLAGDAVTVIRERHILAGDPACVYRFSASSEAGGDDAGVALKA